MYFDRTPKTERDLEDVFHGSEDFPGGFNSVRLYTTRQEPVDVILAESTEAIPAAIKTKTNFVMNLWSSSGTEKFYRELTALQKAIDKYGTELTDLVQAITLGSGDLQRFDDGQEGVETSLLLHYLRIARAAVKDIPLEKVHIGHDDKYRQVLDEKNERFVDKLDFWGARIGPYYPEDEVTDNSIDRAAEVFQESWNEITKHACKNQFG